MRRTNQPPCSGATREGKCAVPWKPSLHTLWIVMEPSYIGHPTTRAPKPSWGLSMGPIFCGDDGTGEVVIACDEVAFFVTLVDACSGSLESVSGDSLKSFTNFGCRFDTRSGFFLSTWSGFVENSTRFVFSVGVVVDWLSVLVVVVNVLCGNGDNNVTVLCGNGDDDVEVLCGKDNDVVVVCDDNNNDVAMLCDNTNNGVVLLGSNGNDVVELWGKRDDDILTLVVSKYIVLLVVVEEAFSGLLVGFGEVALRELAFGVDRERFLEGKILDLKRNSSSSLLMFTYLLFNIFCRSVNPEFGESLRVHPKFLVGFHVIDLTSQVFICAPLNLNPSWHATRHLALSFVHWICPLRGRLNKRHPDLKMDLPEMLPETHSFKGGEITSGTNNFDINQKIDL